METSSPYSQSLDASQQRTSESKKRLPYKDVNIPQQEIRLIRILPARADSESIECQLETASLSTSGLQYAALSYTWGDPDKLSTISINDIKFKFRSNNALLSNGQNSILPLWADAICIDQSDNDERSQQVLLMGSIYSSATKVISWLGTGVKNVEMAFSTIRRILEAAFKDRAEEINEISLLNFMKSEVPRTADFDQLRPEASENNASPWFSISDLFEQSYWHRAWILQELVLAKSADPRLNTFDFVVLLRHDHHEYSKKGASGKFCPSAIVDLSMLYEASDPKDLIYGFLALVQLNATMNYKKELKEVYRDWYNEVMCRDIPHHLNPILYAGRGLHECWKHDLPSWLPDLSRNSEKAFVPRLNSAKHLELEYLKSSPFPDAEVSGYVLHISGLKCCGKIIEVFPIPPDESRDLDDIVHSMSLSVLTRSNKSNHPCDISALQALYYTIYQGHDPETHKDLPIPPDPGFGNTFKAFQFWGVFSKLFLMEEIEDKDYVAACGPEWKRAGYDSIQKIVSALDADFCKGIKCPSALDRASLSFDSVMASGATSMESLGQLVVLCRGKALFQTEDGYIGIGPGGLREGDQPCILDRAFLPILLRKDGENYLNVGACYIYGVSNGEATGTIKPGDPRIERFKIH
ncbi:heterokaryon incompatibility protein-domain-containing protein [Hypoxylon sp. FL1857]|nr:heterokaryon incompatibility protein-domain-containing protein [Hypoxylon sp. FL1857]